MASALIHIAVASEVNKVIHRKENELFIGSIAPDIAKQTGDRKQHSHFIVKQNDDVPDLSLFLDKYKNHLNDDFVLGYYIHLFTDYLWYKYFITEIYSYNLITKLDGTIVRCSQSQMTKYIYSDYTNLNTRLLDEFDLDLKIFYNPIPKMKNIIKEIPMDKLNILIDKMSIIIENSKMKKGYVFDIEDVKQFVNTSSKLIVSKLEELGVVSFNEKR